MAASTAALESRREASRVGRRRIVMIIVVIVNRWTVVMIGVVVVRVRVDVWRRQRRGRAEERGHEEDRQNGTQGVESME